MLELWKAGMDALHRGHSGLWSRLLSMQALQYVWPQGVVTGCQSNLGFT